MKRIRPEGRIVFVFAAVSAIALVVHPQHQQRFLTTSMFALFSGAGIGLAILAQFLAPRNVPARLAIGAAAALAVLAVQFWLPYPAAAYATAIRARSGASNLDLAALYEPFIRPGEDLAIGATFGDTAVLSWPLFERCKCMFQIDRPWVGLQSTRAEAAAAGKSWLETTEARQAVLVDMPGDAGAFWRYEDMVGLVDAVSLQSRFHVGSRDLKAATRPRASSSCSARRAGFKVLWHRCGKSLRSVSMKVPRGQAPSATGSSWLSSASDRLPASALPGRFRSAR